MKPRFPGMNPYLENLELWSEVHFGLIAVRNARSLNSMITPKYRAAVEKRVYLDLLLVGIPDVSVFQRGTEAVKPNLAMATLSEPLIMTVPTAEETQERFLEIREFGTGTVVEVLSPKNKRSGAGKVKISIPNRDLYTTAASTSYILPHSRTGDVFNSNENRYNALLSLLREEILETALSLDFC